MTGSPKKKLAIGTILLIIVSLPFIFRFREVVRQDNIVIYEDRWAGDGWHNSSHHDQFTGKTNYVIAVDNKPFLTMYHGAVEGYKSLMIHDIKNDTLEVYLYISCVNFKAPLNQGRVKVNQLIFVDKKCFADNYRFYSTQYFHDYELFWPEPWFDSVE
jgi:hypothetical protein